MLSSMATKRLKQNLAQTATTNVTTNPLQTGLPTMHRGVEEGTGSMALTMRLLAGLKIIPPNTRIKEVNRVDGEVTAGDEEGTVAEVVLPVVKRVTSLAIVPKLLHSDLLKTTMIVRIMVHAFVVAKQDIFHAIARNSQLHEEAAAEAGAGKISKKGAQLTATHGPTMIVLSANSLTMRS